MPSLTKDPFLAAQVCPSQGWYRQALGTGPINWDLQWRFFQGQEVHRLAAEWSGPGIMLRRTTVEEAAESSREALSSGSGDQYFEATFVGAGCVARADIVRREAAGWAILEVKSGQAPEPSEAPKEEYLADLAYTVMVARASGATITSARLILLNRGFRTGDATTGLFTELDVTALVMPLVEQFTAQAPGVVDQLFAERPPTPRLIPACKSCEYFEDRCLGREIPDPIFLLPRLAGKRFEALAPYRRIANLPPDADLTVTQRTIFEVLRNGEPRVDHAVLAELDGVEWPAWYLDFESVMPALPWHPGDAPYTTTLTQYSLHRVDQPGGEPRHWEYLAELDRDWREELLVSLLHALGDRGSIVVYSSYERMRLREAGESFPDLEPRLAAVRSRLFDLEPFFRKGYLHPGFQGRSSIKYVLPVLVPGLAYDGMAVGNGSDASGLVALMKRGQVPEAEHPRHREDLLAYCRLDTLAMVRLHQRLLELRAGA